MATEMTKRKKTDAATQRENLVTAGNATSPDADIYETDDQLLLILDVPGAEKGGVQIEVDENDTLQVRAKNGFKEPQARGLREFEAEDYFRSFYLGQTYDKGSINAKLENGVLEIRVPKREEAKPRRISINA